MSSASTAPSPAPSSAAPHLVVAAESLLEPSTRLLVWGLLAVALLPRLLLLPFNENLYGDAVVRTELAERWLREPHLMTSYGDGAFQFGPLHLYLVGFMLKVLPERELAGRLVSLFLGTLSVVPLFALARRLFGWRAGVVAGLAFSVWGLHLQLSTTAASEALSLFLMLWVFALCAEGLDENRLGPIFGAAGVLNLACATRYDAWLFIPLLTVGLLLWGKDRVAATTRAVGFGLLCLPFPLLWMQGNELAHGDPFFPIHAVEQFHEGWAREGVSRLGQVGYRLMNLGFWPGVALLTLSPGVALLGMAGMWRKWREEPEVRWLVLAAVMPALYLTFKASVLADFQPMGRFTVTEMVLLLPFVAPGFEALVGARGAGTRWGVAGVTAVVAVALPLAMGLYTFRADGGWRDSLRPVSPTSTNPGPVMEVARFLKREVAAGGGSAVLDSEPGYLDLQLAFFSGLPEERLARVRWETFRKHLRELEPEYLVRFEGGGLEQDSGVKLEGRTLTLDGVVYEEREGFSPPLHVYRRR
jgi:4-amino-4-deoxy-L-arabinose transferase-like glycosyltransferase